MAIDTTRTMPADAAVAPRSRGLLAPTGLLSRVHWGAIFAGAVSAVAILVVLNLFGAAIGLYVLDPAAQDSDVGAAGAATGLWWAISALASCFAGGWVAGRLAGAPVQLTAGLHGLVVWALAVIAAVWLVSTTVRTAFTGAAGLFSGAGQAAAGALPGDVQLLDLAVQAVLNFAQNDLAQELRGLPEGAQLPPDRLDSAAQRASAVTIDAGDRQQLRELAAVLLADVLGSPDDAPLAVQPRADQVFSPAGVITPADRQQATRIIAGDLGISQAQSQRAVDAWAARFSQAGPQLRRGMLRVPSEAGRTVEEAADAVAGAALWTALGLLLALAAAVFGGVAGRPHDRNALEIAPRPVPT